MTDREILAKFNSLLSAGVSLEQATRIAEPAKLTEQFEMQYRYLLTVCGEAGGPPAFALANLEKIAEQRQEARGRLAISSTVPKATARLVLWLPLGAALLGQLVGLGSIEIFFKSALALISLLLGLILLVVAQTWSSRILSKANQPEIDESIAFDAVALCLDAGISVRQARQIAGAKHKEIFSSNIAENTISQVDALIAFSELSGASISKLLRNHAEAERSKAANQQLQKIESVSIRLLAPLAILVLPAFVLVAVLPITISLLTNN